MSNEEKVLGFITSQCTWEDVIYKVIALEGLDPWDIDIAALADGFLKYITKLKELDFHIPAKFIMVAAILLKMKSDYLNKFRKEEAFEQPEQIEEPNGKIESNEQEIPAIPVPPKREPVRKIMIPELILALKKALETQKRREERKYRLQSSIQISHDDIHKRIEELYLEISQLLKSIKKKEIRFSSLIKEGTRDEIVNTFLPVIYLDHQQKLRCRQEEFFDEIWIGRPAAK
jgi:segregation and condensation protein A